MIRGWDPVAAGNRAGAGSPEFRGGTPSRADPEQTLREANRLAHGEQEQQVQQTQEQEIQLDAEFLEQQQQQQ